VLRVSVSLKLKKTFTVRVNVTVFSTGLQSTLLTLFKVKPNTIELAHFPLQLMQCLKC